MCVSATNSFTLSALLIPAGAYSTYLARKEDSSSLPFALIPLIFSTQQFLEGIVWLEIEAQSQLLFLASYGFLFFAYLFWPTYIPFIAYWSEGPGSRRKKVLGLITLFGFFFGMILFFPLILDGESWLRVSLENDSIKYQAAQDIGVPRRVLEVIYFLLILTPFLLSTRSKLKGYGLLLGVTLIIAYALFHYAFISIWCILAATMSLLVPYFVSRSVTFLRRSHPL